MNHQDLINTCIFEQIQGLLFSDLSGPLNNAWCQKVKKYEPQKLQNHHFKPNFR